MHYKKLPAQILVITLLALVIISIIVVGIFNLTTRDLEQTVANREYERLYNIAENQVFQVVDELGAYTDVALQDLIAPSSPSELRNIAPNCVISGLDSLDCTFSEDTTTISMQIEDTSDISEFELSKDDSLTLDLSGFRGNLQFRVTEASGLEFMLVYTQGGEPRVIQDYFDISSPLVFDSEGGDPLTDPGNTHAFDFRPVAGTDYHEFTIGNTAGLPVSGATEYLVLTGRRRTQGLSLLDVTGGAGFPSQIRKISTTSYDETLQANVVARVITQIPLAPQQLAIFNYGLLTPDVVVK